MWQWYLPPRCAERLHVLRHRMTPWRGRSTPPPESDDQVMYCVPRKAAGSDNISGKVLRGCAEQLADVFTDIFNVSCYVQRDVGIYFLLVCIWCGACFCVLCVCFCVALAPPTFHLTGSWGPPGTQRIPNQGREAEAFLWEVVFFWSQHLLLSLSMLGKL